MGLIQVKGDHLAQTRQLVTATHSDYHSTYWGFVPTRGRNNKVVLMMQARNVSHTFNSQNGATISQPGFWLTFPPNAIVSQTGPTYMGTVNVSFYSAFPNDRNFGMNMPGGDFLAVDAQGNDRILYSYGFVTVELRSPQGEKLNLASNKPAQIRMSISSEQRNGAPDVMPFWNFDETDGLWKEDQSLTRNGNAYEGGVKHFSSWNCDLPFDRCTVKGRLKDCVGNTLENGQIEVGQRWLTTDSDGNYETFAPADLQFDVKPTQAENTISAGPFPAETENTLTEINTNDFWGYGIVNADGQLSVFSSDMSKVTSIELSNQTSIQPGQNINISFANRPLTGTLVGQDTCRSDINIYCNYSALHAD